jgi:hypothetical protein
VAKDDQSALRIATTTLDRYIWGTGSVIWDALRRELRIRIQAEQYKQLEGLEAARGHSE